MSAFIRIRLTALTLLWGLLLSPSASGQKELALWKYDKMGTALRLTSVFDPMPTTGYAPIVVNGQNELKTELAWDLAFADTCRGIGGNGSTGSHFRVSVAAQSATSRTLLVPLAMTYGSGGGWRNTGHEFGVTAKTPFFETKDDTTHEERTDEGWPCIAISQNLAELNLTGLNDAVGKRKSTRYGSQDVFGSRFEPALLPGEWLGYSGFDIIMITGDEWLRAPAAARLAIKQWARLGGHLEIYQTTASPMSPAALDLPHEPEQADGAVNWGRGAVSYLSWADGKLDTAAHITRYQGRTRMSHIAYLQDGVSSSPWPLQAALGIKMFGGWQVIVFLVLFGILVGPVNLFILAPAGRRHRLFMTTPIISIGASVVLLGLILFQDGTGGKGRRLAVVEIVPSEAAAYVHQEQMSRTGVLFGSSFTVDPPGTLHQMVMSSTQWTKFKDSRDSQPMQTTLEGNTWSGNWFQSRSEQAQHLSAVIPTRSRLEIKPNADPAAPPVILSSLGFDLAEFYLRTEEEGVWKSPGPIVTGQPITLIPADPAEFTTWWGKTLAHSTAAQNNVMTRQQESPHTFFARATASPFLMPTLSDIKWKEDEVVLYGPLR
jgi:hypothetical protein